MTHPAPSVPALRRLVAEITRTDAELARRAPAAVANAAALVASGWPTQTMGGGAGGGGVSDPTGRAAAQRGDSTVELHVLALHASLRAVQSALGQALAAVSVVESHWVADTASGASQARCSGEHDPTCERNAVRRGMCWQGYRVWLDGQH